MIRPLTLICDFRPIVVCSFGWSATQSAYRYLHNEIGGFAVCVVCNSARARLSMDGLHGMELFLNHELLIRYVLVNMRVYVKWQ